MSGADIREGFVHLGTLNKALGSMVMALAAARFIA